MRRSAAVALLVVGSSLAGCRPGAPRPPNETRVVLRYQPLGPDAGPLRELVERFER